MSIQRYETADGTRYRVRWREHNGRMRSRSFLGKREAQTFDTDIRLRKFKGDVLPRPGRETLAAAYDEWFRLVGSTKATTTQRVYQSVWDAHVRDRFDHHLLVELSSNPQLVYELTAEMREQKVGNAAQRKVLVVLSAVLTLAVELQKIPTNPVIRMRKPPATRLRHPHPFPPVVVERIRLRMMRRQTLDPTGLRPLADACLVTLMSYAGLRPGEALALVWADIKPHIIEIDKAVSDGIEAPTKTRRIRTVPLIAPLHDDLDMLRMAAGMPGPDQLVIPASDGGWWSASEMRNWRNRVWKPVLKDIAGHHTLASLANARPYDCRGTFVSLHLRAGDNPLEIARHCGNSPAVLFKFYANVIAELTEERKLLTRIPTVEEQVIRSRQATEDKEREELDKLTADLIQRPTVTEGRTGSAASFFYADAPAPNY